MNLEKGLVESVMWWSILNINQINTNYPNQDMKLNVLMLYVARVESKVLFYSNMENDKNSNLNMWEVGK